MRYLRMLTNCLIGGMAFASYLTVLVLQINPRYPLLRVPGLAVTLALTYGVHATAAFYALTVLRQIVATEVISPGWISFRVLVWLGSGSAVVASALTWANLRDLGPVLDPDAQSRMAAGALVLTTCAGAMAALVVWHRLSPRRATRPPALVLGAALMASMAVPLMLRGPGSEPLKAARWSAPRSGLAAPAGGARVVAVLLEGASLDIIAPAAAEGRLPNFERLLQRGASLHLATVRPTQPGPVWAAMATGKAPFKNGIRSAASYAPLGASDWLEVLPDYCYSHALVEYGFLRERVHSSRDFAARPLWNLLGAQGVAVGIVNMAVSQPAREVLGYLVSDQFVRMLASAVDVEATGGVWPAEAATVAASAAAQAARDRQGAGAGTPDPMSELVAQPCSADLSHERIGAELESRFATRFQAVRYECLDAVGHYFLRYARPAAFGDVTEEELQRYGTALLSHYAAADELVGRAMAALRSGDLLLVMSGFGMEPMSVGKRLLERAVGNARLSGTHEPAPDGFLFAFGTDVRPGRYARGSVADLTPTVLYFFGLPVGRDMDGFARTDIFAPEFTGRRPITYIPSYE
ncbi:MAG TPA: alkaline phosphatase family protein [Vicinamibacterales bacterium]|nr:alkaline phosphatase family protein [Vicinamibacterales bacterium]